MASYLDELVAKAQEEVEQARQMVELKKTKIQEESKRLQMILKERPLTPEELERFESLCGPHSWEKPSRYSWEKP